LSCYSLQATLPGMGRARVYSGDVSQWDKPEWGPLLDAVGEQVTGDFMWMHEAELDNGMSLHAYKHIDTRRYVHLAANGEAFVYEHPNRYRSLPVADAFAAVFASLVGLAGVTGDQVAASWAAVERLQQQAARARGRA
jgi:hypothetical protein